MRKRVEAVLAKIRPPSIQADGGDVELVEISEDNVVTVKLTGACVGCPMAQLTLKGGIERILKHEIPPEVVYGGSSPIKRSRGAPFLFTHWEGRCPWIH